MNWLIPIMFGVVGIVAVMRCRPHDQRDEHEMKQYERFVRAMNKFHNR